MKIEGLGDRSCLRTEAFDSGVHDTDPNIPLNSSIFSRQGNTDVGKWRRRSDKSVLRSRWRIAWSAVQDSQAESVETVEGDEEGVHSFYLGSYEHFCMEVMLTSCLMVLQLRDVRVLQTNRIRPYSCRN